ncbi:MULTISPECIES: M15 family metallopeptidase [Prochlorococcus]|uniref:M15 family metallopeptidase n=1 Tax=Prochlorococcus TaxID=1218 RepID=UPI00053396CA|nr:MULTISPECIES: M15 family metallopeptidase [Prochlorococcus]KGG12342.1 D-alanyl-D-alanine carboxypeptidase [Prochlorococcus sp. MIT 0601]
MSRADTARNKSSDEIPLALRSRPVRPNRAVYKKFLLIALSSIGLFSFLWISNFLSIRDVFYKQIAVKSLNDERLLGHYPYPEALKKDLVEVYPGLEVHKDTYFALDRMRSAASRDGIKLVLLSGFRSVDLQRSIFYENKSLRNQIAIERARVSAPPGYSEHSTGYAIDLGDGTRRDTDFEVSFEATPAFRWLKANAAKYHFILSFPKGNSQKVSYEPWHWRFEGTVEALEQFKRTNQELLRQSSKY